MSNPDSVATAPHEFDAYLPDALDMAAPDVNRCGGLWELRKIATVCDAYGVSLTTPSRAEEIPIVRGEREATTC